MRRTIIPWIAAFGILALATVGGVALANATVLGAGSFVSGYLDAIARGDAEGALSFPGVDAAGADPALLADEALTGLTAVRQLSDEDLGDGLHCVTFSWRSPGGDGSTAFLVERVGTRFGAFPVWAFAQSPVAVVSLTVSNTSAFFANGLEGDTGIDRADAVDFALFVPGSYVVGHDSPLLTADDATLVLDLPGQHVDATIEVRANADFVDRVQQEVDAYLDDCAEQEVLFPTGCPFGRAIENRVAGEPEWSIVTDPVIRIVPGPDFGTWTVPATPGDARLRVDVQSLFDGSLSTVDEEVDFTVDFLITVTGPSSVELGELP